MGGRGQGQPDPAPKPSAPFAGPGKKNETPLLNRIERLIEGCRPSVYQERTWQRLRSHLLSDLVTLGRHTIAARILTGGRADRDWSADYRLYSLGRFDPQALFAQARRRVEAALPDSAPFLAAVDDSILRKSGTRIPGVAYRRDPMGPPFQTNFVRALRVLQISAIRPGTRPESFRAIPIDFVHAPTPQKPRRKAGEQAWKEYRSAAEKANINLLAAQRIRRLRGRLEPRRPLWMLCDGRLTNGRILKGLPPGTAVIGRIRRDAKLYRLPERQPDGAGRKRIYGKPAPTPEQLRRDGRHPWRTVSAYACGKRHEFRIKTLGPVRWRATSDKVLRIIVVAPLKYRLRKGSKTLYRDPAYLVCTDPHAPLADALQAYLRRWDIEVNFRDEKTLLGAAHPQVRNPNSVENAPALTAAAYALLLTAAAETPEQEPPAVPRPKWRRAIPRPRTSTPELIQSLRCELWAKAIRMPYLSDFSDPAASTQKSLKSNPCLSNAVFYACG